LPLPHNDFKQVPDLGDHPFFSNLFFDPSGNRLTGGHYGHRLSVVPLDGGEARRLEGFLSGTIVESLAFSPSGRLVAAASSLSHNENTLRVWNLDTGETKVFDLPRSDNRSSAELGAGSAAEDSVQPALTGYEGNVQNLWFTDEDTLFTVGASGFLRWNLENGSSDEVVALGAARFRTAVASADGQRVLIMEDAAGTEDVCDIPELFDLATGASVELPSFGDCVRMMALDPGGTVAVTGDAEGVIRVGRLTGGEPHLLAGHEGAIEYVAVSPDLRWVASAGSDGTLRLWPMPDLEKPPLHTLPHQELLAKLRSLTNLRAVQDPESSTGWRIEIGPFPGWKEIPTW
jgi:WD40 repeat protein